MVGRRQSKAVHRLLFHGKNLRILGRAHRDCLVMWTAFTSVFC